MENLRPSMARRSSGFSRGYSENLSILTDSTNASLVLFNEQIANLVDLNKIDPIPEHVNPRQFMEIINVAYMRTCKMNQIAHSNDIDLTLLIKNITHIVEVLDLITAQKVTQKVPEK